MESHKIPEVIEIALNTKENQTDKLWPFWKREKNGEKLISLFYAKKENFSCENNPLIKCTVYSRPKWTLLGFDYQTASINSSATS